MKRHLQCAEQQVSRSNLTNSCACHAERLTYLVLITYETSFSVRGATGVTIQPHQILCLPRKMTRLLYRPHIWNVISNARSNRCHYPTSPNTAPATKNDTARFQRKSPKTGETSFPMRGRSDHDPSMIRAWSENENANRNPPRKWGYFARSPEAFSIVKYNVLHPILQSNFHQILRLPRKVTLQLHQVLRLPRKVPLERHQVLHLPRKVTNPQRHTTFWNIYFQISYTYQTQPWQSANADNIAFRSSLVFVAAVRKNIRPEETFTVISPTLNKHNHCSPQRHTIFLFDFLFSSWPQSAKTYDLKKHLLSDLLHVTSTTIAVRKDIIYSARNNRCHDPTAANTAPVTQKDSHLSPHHIWNVIYSARSNRCHDPTSPNTAPVTQKASHT